MQMFYFSYGYTWLIVSLVVPPPTDIILGKVLFNRSFIDLVQSYIPKPDHTHVMDFPATYNLTLQVMQVGRVLLARAAVVTQLGFCFLLPFLGFMFWPQNGQL